MSTQEQTQEPRFGDAQLDAKSASPGDVVWRDGTAPALVVSVNEAEGVADVAVTIAPLTVETVHADDLASEYVDPATGMTAAGAPPTGPAPVTPIAATMPPADDPSKQTTPTGAPIGGGTAVAEAAAATVPASDREAEQDARIAELEAKLADETARAERAETANAAPPEPPAVT